MRQAWISTPWNSTPFKRFDQRLRANCQEIGKLEQPVSWECQALILIANEVVLSLDGAMEKRTLSSEERDVRRILKQKLPCLASL